MMKIILSCAVAMGASVAFADDTCPTPEGDACPPETAPLAEEATEAEMDEGVDNIDVDVAPTVDVDVDETAMAEEAPADTSSMRRTLDPRNPNYSGGLGNVKIMAGSGDFTQENVRDVTGVGPSWDVRGVFGAQFPIGLEAAYVGNFRGIGGLGVDDETQLVSNGVEGDLRLAIPIRASELVDVRPFAFGGVGWQYMTLWGDGAVDGDNDDGDHIMTIPAGLGVEVAVGGLNLDLRGTYRHAIGSDIFGDASSEFDDPDALHQYNISAGVGVEF